MTKNGICFSIADTALAFAANSHNLKSLSIETSISLIKKLMEIKVKQMKSQETTKL